MKSNPFDELVVICGPKWTAVVQGSKIYQCAKCGVDCSCSPVGQKLINEENAKPYCPKCGQQHMIDMEAKGEKVELMDPTEAFRAAVDFIKSHPNN